MSVTGNFITTIRNSEQALEIAKDMGEVAVDAILSDKFGIDGVLKDVPILNIIVSLYKAGNKISAHFFAKNVLAFLTEINRVPNEKRIEFLNKNCATEEGIENIGEVTLMILDKLDHPKLATMLGRAFSLMTLGVIDKHAFDIYAHTIKMMNPYLLQQLKQCYLAENAMAVDGPAASILANYGLLKVGYKLDRSGDTSGMDLSIAPTDFGKFFYKKIVVGDTGY